MVLADNAAFSPQQILGRKLLGVHGVRNVPKLVPNGGANNSMEIVHAKESFSLQLVTASISGSIISDESATRIPPSPPYIFKINTLQKIEGLMSRQIRPSR